MIFKSGKSEYLNRLCDAVLEIAPDRKLALAFSAGVDSTILLDVLHGMGCDVLAVTFNTNLTSRMLSISDAAEYVKALGFPHITLDIDVMADENILNNDKERCYYCKSLMFSALRNEARVRGYEVCCDGTNSDDLLEYRPGLRAKDEYDIKSPIAIAGLSKAELRFIGRELGLPIADAPSSPCLLTRFPYDYTVTKEMLEMVESGEEILKNHGFTACRLRMFNKDARIEIPKEQFGHFENVSENVFLELKKLGYKTITLDKQGLRSGSMDEQ